jgi:hypothetical protein
VLASRAAARHHRSMTLEGVNAHAWQRAHVSTPAFEQLTIDLASLLYGAFAYDFIADCLREQAIQPLVEPVSGMGTRVSIEKHCGV